MKSNSNRLFNFTALNLVQAFKNASIFVLTLLKIHWVLACIFFIISTILGLLPVLELIILGRLVNALTALTSSTFQQDELYVSLAILIGLMACRNLFSVINEGIEDYLRDKATGELQQKILMNSYRVELSFFDNEKSYDQLQRANAGLGYRLVNIMLSMTMVFQNMVTIVGMYSTLTIVHWGIGIIILVVGIPSFLIKIRNSQEKYIHDYNTFTPTRRKLSYFENILTNSSFAKEVRLFNLSNHILERWKIHQKIWKKEHMNTISKEMRYSIITEILINTTFAIIAIFLVNQIVKGVLDLGTFVMMLAMVTRFQGYIEGIIIQLKNIYQDGLFSQNLFEFINIQIDQTRETGSVFPVKMEEGIRFENVWFRYPGSEDWTLRDINIHIPTNSTLSIIGRNGSGKTTLIKLLLRLYKPQKGCIYIDGVRLEDISENDLRTNLSAIFQDFARFQLTLKESIGFGNVDHLGSLERIKSSALLSGADKVARDLPEGYDTILSKAFGGVNLSQGQWQKIALARMFMCDAKILILDEPSSSLDPLAEVALFEQFKNIARCKTTILISHRIGTARLADTILVLKNGEIVEVGSHYELLNENGEYAELYNLQAQWYNNTEYSDSW